MDTELDVRDKRESERESKKERQRERRGERSGIDGALKQFFTVY